MAAAPPVPALPDTQRLTEYAILAQTGPFDVGFALYGDQTDYGEWVEVWLNSVQLTPVSDFTLSSPSGSLATLARPITDAQITLVAPGTGDLVIVGARRPRRVAQFSEDRGVTSRDLNQFLTDIVATQREEWDFRERLARVPAGETMAILPPLAQRASLPAFFDSFGNLTPGSIIANTFVSAAMTPVVQAATLALGRGLLGVADVVEISTASVVGLFSVPSDMDVIRTRGFATVGDGGDGIYERTGGAPPNAFNGWVQDAAGQYFELRSLVVNPRQFGGTPTGTAGANQSTFINRMIGFANAKTFVCIIDIGPGIWPLDSRPTTITRILEFKGVNGDQPTIFWKRYVEASAGVGVINATNVGGYYHDYSIRGDVATASGGAGQSHRLTSAANNLGLLFIERVVISMGAAAANLSLYIDGQLATGVPVGFRGIWLNECQIFDDVTFIVCQSVYATECTLGRTTSIIGLSALVPCDNIHLSGTFLNLNLEFTTRASFYGDVAGTIANTVNCDLCAVYGVVQGVFDTFWTNSAVHSNKTVQAMGAAGAGTWVKYSDRTLEQWATGVTDGTGSVTITWPIAFGAGPVEVFANAVDAPAANQMILAQAHTITSTTIKVRTMVLTNAPAAGVASANVGVYGRGQW